MLTSVHLDIFNDPSVYLMETTRALFVDVLVRY